MYGKKLLKELIYMPEWDMVHKYFSIFVLTLYFAFSLARKKNAQMKQIFNCFCWQFLFEICLHTIS